MSSRRPKLASKEQTRLVPPWEPPLPVGDAVTRRQVVAEAEAHRRVAPSAGAFDVGLEALTVW
ncbi:MAG TPA: hypothetical protein ENK57_21770 [Polyangiaceae bacterium]|nr:hypothetical protein [Polyangiaceae bacterium]